MANILSQKSIVLIFNNSSYRFKCVYTRATFCFCNNCVVDRESSHVTFYHRYSIAIIYERGKDKHFSPAHGPRSFLFDTKSLKLFSIPNIINCKMPEKFWCL